MRPNSFHERSRQVTGTAMIARHEQHAIHPTAASAVTCRYGGSGDVAFGRRRIRGTDPRGDRSASPARCIANRLSRAINRPPAWHRATPRLRSSRAVRLCSASTVLYPDSARCRERHGFGAFAVTRGRTVIAAAVRATTSHGNLSATVFKVTRSPLQQVWP